MKLNQGNLFPSATFRLLFWIRGFFNLITHHFTHFSAFPITSFLDALCFKYGWIHEIGITEIGIAEICNHQVCVS